MGGDRWLTAGLVAQALADLASLLEVDVPALSLTGAVLEGEGVDSVALLDGVLAVRVGGVEGRVDNVKGGRGRELVYLNDAGQLSARTLNERGGARGIDGPLVRDIVAVDEDRLGEDV